MKYFIVVFGIVLIVIRSTYCCSCLEPKPEDAICGSDGDTWASDCTLFCTAFYRNETTEPCLSKVHDGKCGPSPCICKDICRYVCASDGSTFGNDCTLGCAQKKNRCLRKIKDGKCGECICTLDYRPVCGSDCNTYSNRCALKCQQETDLWLYELYEGECKKNCCPISPPKCSCSNECKPVCGSNGRTYNNKCLLECAQKIERNLKQIKYGVCGECICTLQYSPVCGSDGKTYGNSCQFNCEKETNPGLTLAHNGSCEEPPNQQCHR